MHKKSLKGNLLRQEIAQQLMSLFAENALGMKLHAFQRQCFMAETHDLVGLTVAQTPGGDLERIGQRLALHDQRMVAGDSQGIVEIAEHAFAGVLNGGGFAVHHLTGAHHLRTIRLRDSLMTQTNAQHRQLPGKVADGRQ